MSWIRGQQDAPSLLKVSSDVSIKGRQWQPLSVRQFLTYCHPPIAHDMNDT